MKTKKKKDIPGCHRSPIVVTARLLTLGACDLGCVEVIGVAMLVVGHVEVCQGNGGSISIHCKKISIVV